MRISDWSSDVCSSDLLLAVSPFGRALRAMRENELAVQSIGKNVVALKLIAFALSAGAAAIAGSLLAPYIAFVSPQSFSIDDTILVLAKTGRAARRDSVCE